MTYPNATRSSPGPDCYHNKADLSRISLSNKSFVFYFKKALENAMKESQFGFRYSWADLKPIRALSITVTVVQVIGATIGYVILNFPDQFESVWVGGAMATLPGFIIGAVIQTQSRPGSITENAIMVRRLGLIATLFSSIALAMFFKGGGNVR